MSQILYGCSLGFQVDGNDESSAHSPPNTTGAPSLQPALLTGVSVAAAGGQQDVTTVTTIPITTSQTTVASPTSIPPGQLVKDNTPKRLHVSNIPFRFRDPDLRNLFGVSCFITPPHNPVFRLVNTFGTTFNFSAHNAPYLWLSRHKIPNCHSPFVIHFKLKFEFPLWKTKPVLTPKYFSICRFKFSRQIAWPVLNVHNYWIWIFYSTEIRTCLVFVQKKLQRSILFLVHWIQKGSKINGYGTGTWNSTRSLLCADVIRNRK